MIELSTAAGVVVVSTVAVAAAGWGAMVSVRSAIDGPEWALRHLRRAVPAALAVMGLGVLAVIWVSPVWVGLAVIYVAVVAAWLARRVSRRLAIAAEFGEFVPPSPARQASILRQTARGLISGGLLIVAVGIADLAWRGWPALFDFVLAAALLLPGVIYLRRAERLTLEPAIDG